MTGKIRIKITDTTHQQVTDAKVDAVYREYMNRYGKRFTRGERYRKYLIITEDEVHEVTRKHRIDSGEVQPIVSNMVVLGGPFEEVGGEDEIIGSGDQELG